MPARTPSRSSTRPAQTCFACQTRPCSEWAALTREEIGLLNDARTCNRYGSGQIIFYQGNACLGVYCIMEGMVALRKNDAGGNSVIVRLADAGQTLGYRAFFAGSRYEATAEAATDCVICFIDHAAVRRLLDQNPAIGERFLTRLARDLEDAEHARLDLQASSVRARLAHLLLVLKDRHGRADHGGSVVIDLPLSRQDVAAMIGARPETVSRAIKGLAEDGVARFAGREVVVPDLDRLLDELEPGLERAD